MPAWQNPAQLIAKPTQTQTWETADGPCLLVRSPFNILSPRQNRSLISERRELAWLEHKLVHTPVVPNTEQSISSPAHHGGGGTTYGPDVPKKRLRWDAFQSPNSAFNKKTQTLTTGNNQHLSAYFYPG